VRVALSITKILVMAATRRPLKVSPTVIGKLRVSLPLSMKMSIITPQEQRAPRLPRTLIVTQIQTSRSLTI
jgi:hypothetical protein